MNESPETEGMSFVADQTNLNIQVGAANVPFEINAKASNVAGDETFSVIFTNPGLCVNLDQTNPSTQRLIYGQVHNFWAERVDEDNKAAKIFFGIEAVPNEV